MTDTARESRVMTRRAHARRALSFLELAAVLAIVGLLALSAIATFGSPTLSNGGAEGFVRKLSLALVHARRATIATGDNHYLQLSPSAANATNFALFRRTSGGNVQVDQSRTAPQDVTLSSSHAVLEFDFDGAALAGYSLDVAGNGRSWNISVVTLTGAPAVSETTP
jgi:type II secretory pathway pseudopilin PulG